jgi:hypothetical protein
VIPSIQVFRATVLISAIYDSLCNHKKTEIFEIYMQNSRIAGIGKKSVLGTPSNLGLIMEHISNLTEVRIVLINHHLPESLIMID